MKAIQNLNSIKPKPKLIMEKCFTKKNEYQLHYFLSIFNRFGS